MTAPSNTVTTNGSGSDFFGADIDRQLQKWWIEEFLPEFHKKYDVADGPEAEIVVCILDDGATHDWHNPLSELAHLLTSTDDHKRVHGPEGLCANVAGKLAWVLRTKLPSRLARRYRWLLRRGDFPHQGAETYRYITGGASGLPNGKDDIWCFRQVVAKMIQLRIAATAGPMEDSRLRKPGMKYLGGNPLELLFKRSRTRRTAPDTAGVGGPPGRR